MYWQDTKTVEGEAITLMHVLPTRKESLYVNGYEVTGFHSLGQEVVLLTDDRAYRLSRYQYEAMLLQHAADHKLQE